MTIGILGGGQLGYMLALAGYPLGLRFRFLDPSAEAPVGRIAHRVIADYDDQAALEKFASGLEVITYEFENVPVDATRFLSKHAPVFPAPAALETAQDRLKEKSLFRKLAIDTTEFAPVHDPVSLDAAIKTIGLPAVLKTCRFGYDGKGQWPLRTPEDIASAKREAFQQQDFTPQSGANNHANGNQPNRNAAPLILENFISFTREVSILAVRSRQHEILFYPLVENRHHGGILRLSLAPAPNLDPSLQHQAETYAKKVLEALDYIGVLAIEFFECNGRLLANEMAPRVHNSGHWSIEGAVTSQFENHLRAIADFPLGATDTIGASAMLNLIGTTPPTNEILAISGAHLHLYGKSPRPGRKLGHLTLRAANHDELAQRLNALPQYFHQADFCLDTSKTPIKSTAV
jgi:5-(carboxyamino)imidazole ribonucleotide synthase